MATELTSTQAYAQEVERIRKALGSISVKTAEFETVAAKGDRAHIGWDTITDVTWARIQLEDVANRLHGTGQYAVKKGEAA